ncbi:NAD(P)-dependent oxidoreductase [Micromonospora sp. NPDC005652]|uniref:NAD-dependent epimerase/dehydratase family protein n=1 Tax=Micromonospora sp. NPDC005652 TaxID=3157046 RepID=UPI0033C88839
MKVTTTVVTGAAGFLGRAVLRQLSGEPDADVVACVRRSAPLPGVPNVAVDLAGPDAPGLLRAALADAAGPVRLVHLAGEYRSGSVERQFDDNVSTTLGVLEALRDRLSHVVYASSVAVYGSHRRVGAVRQVAPDTCYGRAKRLAESALDLFARHRGVPVAVLRLSSLYGPGNPSGNAVAAVTTAMADGRPFEVRPASPSTAEGTPVIYARDYLHVADAARAVAVASRTGFAGTLDVGSGTTATPYNLAAVARSLGHRVDIEDLAPGAPVVRFDCDPAPALVAFELTPVALVDGIADELNWRISGGGGW